MRLIDADALGIGRCNPDAFPLDTRAYCAGWNGVIGLIEQAPTIDAVPVVHGRWVSVDGEGECDEYDCSACGQRKTFLVEMSYEDMVEEYPYCPKCGADMRRGKTMDFNDLIGAHVLSGIETGKRDVERHFGKEECNFVKITLDGVTYLATENTDDGYRSYMDELQIVEERCKFALPDIKVVCTRRSGGSWDVCGYDVLDFIDIETGKKILAIGTDHTESYYPMCIMEYHPENMACNSGRI